MIWNLLTSLFEGGASDGGTGNGGAGDGGTGGTNWVSIVIMGVLVLAIIGLFVWQSIKGKKKQKEAQDMVGNLKVGDRVKTIGGICGFVAEINDNENTFVLETGLEDRKSYVKFDKGAIYQTAPAQGNAVSAPVPEKKAEPEVKEEVKNEETASEEKKD